MSYLSSTLPRRALQGGQRVVTWERSADGEIVAAVPGKIMYVVYAVFSVRDDTATTVRALVKTGGSGGTTVLESMNCNAATGPIIMPASPGGYLFASGVGLNFYLDMSGGTVPVWDGHFVIFDSPS